MNYINNKDFTNFRLFNNKFSYLYIKYSDLIGILIDGEPVYTFNTTGYSFEKYQTGYHYLKGRQEIYANSEGRTFIELISKREYFEQTGIK